MVSENHQVDQHDWAPKLVLDLYHSPSHIVGMVRF